MRKIIVSAMVSMDGVMQAPGGPEEDPTGGFAHGGWAFPYWDATSGSALDDLMAQPFDLLLGRRTYDIFAAYWPHVDRTPASDGSNERFIHIADRFDRATKYVLTHRSDGLPWPVSAALGDDPVARLRALKQEDGPILLTQGSTELLALLFANDLVDMVSLSTFPLLLGKGKRMFDGNALPRAFRLASSKTTPAGVVLTTYERAGAVEPGSFASETPSEQELERRRGLA